MWKSRYFLAAVAILIGGVIKYVQDAGGANEVVMNLIPYVPSHWLQHLGMVFCNVLTVQILPLTKTLGIFKPLQCFKLGHEDDLLVSIAVNKGGSVFSAQLAWEMIMGCGITAALGSKEDDMWPPKTDPPPPFDVQLYFGAGNARNWTQYAEKRPKSRKHVHCVVFTRDPLDRLFSMYKYAWDGGESGLRHASSVMQSLNSSTERLKYVWQSFGRETMLITHETLMLSLAPKNNCTQIYIDDLFKGGAQFDKGLLALLEKWQVREEVKPILLDRFRKHDLSRQSDEKLAANEHISGKKMPRKEKVEVLAAIDEDKEIQELLTSQRKELGYLK